MSSINFNDYVNYANYDSGYDVSALLGGTSNAAGNIISDYASIKNGSYGKLMKAYYAKQDAEKATLSGDSRQKLTLMRSNADSLKKSADALKDSNVDTLKSLFTGHGSFSDRISQKADRLSHVAANTAAGAKTATYTGKGGYSDTLSKLFSSTVDEKIGNKDKSSETYSKNNYKKEDKEKDKDKDKEQQSKKTE